MRVRFEIALLLLFLFHGSASNEEPAHEPFPKDGLDEPSVGIPGLPLELKDGHGDVRRRKAAPAQVPVGSVVQWTVEFEYPYADAAVEKAAIAEGRAIGIRLVGFLSAGLAHRWLFERFIDVSPEALEEGTTVLPWNTGLTRAALEGLVFQGSTPTAVGLRGIVRHTALEVSWDRRPSREEGGEEPAAVQRMRTQVAATWEIAVGAVRTAPPSESPNACKVSSVLVTSIAAGRSGIPRSRLMATAKHSPDRHWLPATMWIQGRVYTNLVGGKPTGALSADFASPINLDEARIYCVDESDAFRLLHVTKFRNHPLGAVWP